MTVQPSKHFNKLHVPSHVINGCFIIRHPFNPSFFTATIPGKKTSSKLFYYTTMKKRRINREEEEANFTIFHMWPEGTIRRQSAKFPSEIKPLSCKIFFQQWAKLTKSWSLRSGPHKMGETQRKWRMMSNLMAIFTSFNYLGKRDGKSQQFYNSFLAAHFQINEFPGWKKIDNYRQNIGTIIKEIDNLLFWIN